MFCERIVNSLHKNKSLKDIADAITECIESKEQFKSTVQGVLRTLRLVLMTTVEMENHQNINSFFHRVLLFNPVLGSKTKPSRKHNHIPIIFFNYRIQLSEFTIFFSSQRFSLFPIQNINSRWMK